MTKLDTTKAVQEWTKMHRIPVDKAQYLVECVRLRQAFDEVWKREGWANYKPYSGDSGVEAFAVDLREAMKGNNDVV